MLNSISSSVWKWIKNSPCFVFTLVFIVVFYIYCELAFPDNLRDLVPEKFESHKPKNLTLEAQSFQSMQSTIYNNTLASMCEDVQISSSDRAYCINENSDIVEINTRSQKVKKIGNAGSGRTYGIKLSKNQQLLYFVNSVQGLCQFNLKTKRVTSLVSQYQGEFLLSLNSIQVHPTNPNVLYVTQSSTRVPLQFYTIDLLINNPLGRLFEYNKDNSKLKLIADGLYFVNGLTFQMYKNEETVLVAQSNRFRLTRVFLNGQSRGTKKTAVDKLDVYLDNLKANEKGEIWVAGPSMRNDFLYTADHNPWIRSILSKIPPTISKILVGNEKIFGGLKITFAEDKQTYKVQYVIWRGLLNFSFVTGMQERNEKLYVSSLTKKGVIVFDDINRSLKKLGKKKIITDIEIETVDQWENQNNQF